MADTVILAEQTLTFTVEGGFGQATMIPAPFVLTDGETYRVELDGEEYELVCATDVDTGWPALVYFVTDENETPTSGFAILYGSEEAVGMEGGFVGVTVVGNDETHTLAIYHVAEETNTGGGGQTTTGANIVLRDRNGKEVQYPGVSYIKVNTVDGGTQGFAAYDPETLKAENIKNGVTVGDVEGALSVPELLEDMPIALDFSNGDMEITAQDGYAVKSAVIQKPANLTPGNIVKDVDIAGVVGTLEMGGGGEAEEVVEKDVCFYDYDGTCLYSYTADEAMALTALPPLPSHDGLICQGWTHTLTEVQSYITDCDFCDVGVYYITDDGSTRTYIHVYDPTCEIWGYRIKSTVDGGVSIDWGDGVIDTLTGCVSAYKDFTHTYEHPGAYCIKILVAEGCELTVCGQAGGANNPSSCVKKIELGKSLYQYADKTTVYSITMPKDYPHINGVMGGSAMAIFMPSTVPGTSYRCAQARKKVVFPPSVSTLNSSMLSDTSGGGHTVRRIALPPAITTVSDYLCQQNKALTHIAIPPGVTAINKYAFRGCNKLLKVKIPPSVTSLGDYVFNNCSALRVVDFSKHTAVPTLGTYAFTSVYSACQILVPSALASSWKAATNWKSWASYIVAV